MPRRIQRALVTGASSGIGEAFVRHLAARGVELVLVARREDRLRALAASSSTRADVLAADLTVAADLARVEARLASHEEPIDLLVNNAGFGAYGAFTEVEVDRQHRMVELNVVALVRCAHAVLPQLLVRGTGGVINVGSVAGAQPDPFAATYGATKAFVRSFSHALHEEVRGRGVTVTLLAPGLTRTEFADVSDVHAPGAMERIGMTADDVVVRALRDFAQGRANSIPGTRNLLAVAAGGTAPVALSRRVSGLVHRRMSHG
ncbi:SDR family NAD(P)-dependent oxidoreductase [Egicoccus sp. AB-alg6-2]|uniref:SDR family NAD(P)-dependent oxidoreductase n=1 Tax=Egicoccus sp. AB-alg6-2 TaxID=3242692 RepID=UPI00359E49E2